MTPAEFAQYVRFKTRTNSSTFTDADMLMLMNIHKDDLATEIIKANEDYFGTPETADLVAGQRQYPFPDDMLNQVKHVEAKLDGTNQIPLAEFDLTGYQRSTDETTITNLFSNTEGNAYFDIFSNSIWIYSGTITSVSAGLKIWSYQWPAKFTNLASTTDMAVDPSNTTVGFPRAFHELLARRVIIEYKTSGDKAMQLTDSELKYDVDLQRKLDSISEMNMSRSNTAALPSGKKLWNDGHDL